MRNQWHRFRRDEAGAVLPLLVILPVLAGMLALGMETGKLYTIQRQMQNAADSAALAGSKDLIAGLSGSITTDAQYEAQRAGFTNGLNGVAVNVSTSVTAPAGQTAYTNAVQVSITKPMSFSFAGVLNAALSSSSTFNMRATSVAAQSTYSSTTTTTQTVTTTTSSADGCFLALVPNADNGITLSSFNNLTTDCLLMSDGTATGTGSSASVNLNNFNNATLKSIWTRGSYSVASYNHVTLTNAALQNQTSFAVDPYASLGTPSPGACTYTNYQEPSGSDLTLSPGTYCGGLSVTSKSNVYFTAGTYYIANGDLVISSDNNVSCSNCTNGAGVTFVLTQTTGNASNIGGVSISSENNVTLSAPSSGTYKGVLFYQDRNVANGARNATSKIFTLSSLNNATLYGAIYFPKNAINISSINNMGGNSSTGCTVWIVRFLNFSNYNNNYIAGCSTYGTTPAGIGTTTTTTTTVPVTQSWTAARVRQ